MDYNELHKALVKSNDQHIYKDIKIEKLSKRVKKLEKIIQDIVSEKTNYTENLLRRLKEASSN